jgi:hypothetical protein
MKNVHLHSILLLYGLILKGKRHKYHKNKLYYTENKVLKVTFGSRREEVVGEWRILHNEELCNLPSSPNISRVMKSRMACSTHGEMRNAYKILSENMKGKSHFETYA